MKNKLGILVLTLSSLVLAAGCASSGSVTTPIPSPRETTPRQDLGGHDDSSDDLPSVGASTAASQGEDPGHDDTSGDLPTGSPGTAAGPKGKDPGHDDTSGDLPTASAGSMDIQ